MIKNLLLVIILSAPCLFIVMAGDLPSVNVEQQIKPLNTQRKIQLIHMVKQDCGSCHGMTLKGGLGPALLPENVKDKPLKFLQNTILYGRPGTAMPPWKNILTEQESLWISKQLQQGIENVQ